MIRKFFSIMLWFAINFVVPTLCIIFGLNLFFFGAGIHYHIDPNSFTVLGLWVARSGLPVTPPSKPIKLMPLKTLDKDDPFTKELEKALGEQMRKNRDMNSEQKENNNGGPGSGTPRC